MGGSGPHEGNIFVGGFPVCDDHHGVENARVVCRFDESKTGVFISTTFQGVSSQKLPRMMGYSFGLHTKDSHFGQVSHTFGMDDVRCTGNETSILDCPHVTANDCDSGKGAGVVCYNSGWLHCNNFWKMAWPCFQML